MPLGDIEQLREVFLKARGLPSDQRYAYLDQACGDDPAFRQEVERLLLAHEGETFGVPQGDIAYRDDNTQIGQLLPEPFPVSSLPPGYRFIRELGRGGQAVVCAAIQQSTGQTVAIKIMRDGPLANASSRARFDREAQVLAALQHPSIVKVLDRGISADTSQYIVMDYIDGCTLGEWIRRRAAKPTEGEDGSLLRMFMKICSAINAAHLRGIIHRDIKPSNILIDERGEPYVLDFGLARPLFDVSAADQSVTLTGQFLGSLPWASPEQAEGKQEKIDTRSDVYALGVILYQLLTSGQFPYEVAGNMRDVLNNILTAEPTPPSRVMAARQAREMRNRRLLRQSPPPLNEVIEAITLKTLSKRRDDRYQTAGELEREIANYLAGLPTIAAGRRGLRGHERQVLGILVATAIIVVGSLIWDIAWRHGKQTDSARAGTSAIPLASLANSVRSPDKFVSSHSSHSEPRLEITNSIGMKFVEIRPGTFLMGSPPTETGREQGETQHEVTLTQGYYLGSTPVTVGQFARFVTNSGYRTEAEIQGSSFGWDHRNTTMNGNHQGVSWKAPGFPQLDNSPVVNVSWNDAVAFCSWLSDKEHRQYRLPTEAEWEYACRAGTTTTYFFGDDVSKLKEYAWYGEGPDWPSAVGRKKPNPWGLHDMIGNVWQWCGDGFAPYPTTPVTDPHGPSDAQHYELRGGAWYCSAIYDRPAYRWISPGARPSERRDCWGFRVALDADSVSSEATKPAETAMPIRVHVLRPNGWTDLAKAGTLVDGDELRIEADVPAESFASLLLLDPAGNLQELSHLDPSDEVRTIVFPEAGKAVPLTKPDGTELVLLAIRRDRSINISELKAHWPWLGGCPAIAPGTLVELADTGVQSFPELRSFGPAQAVNDPISQTEERVRQIQHWLSDQGTHARAVAFAHSQLRN